MKNPWLSIPASDYEGHMGLPDVDQLSFLGRVFKQSIAKHDSSAVAYLGCATGNGLEFVNYDDTQRLTAIDINPEYLEILRNRYHGQIPNLEIIEADLERYQGKDQRYSFIFAGLIFEYLAPGPLLEKISRWLNKAGVMVVVLQLKDNQVKKVSDTPYSSLKLLGPIMNLVSVENFKWLAEENGLKEIQGTNVILESGKTFYTGTYKNNEKS